MFQDIMEWSNILLSPKHSRVLDLFLITGNTNLNNKMTTCKIILVVLKLLPIYRRR